MENQELFTDKITKGNRTYFFDVKRAENGGLFLSISESKRTEAGFQKYNIVIFEEDIEDVKRVFNRAVKKLGVLSAGGEEKGYLDAGGRRLREYVCRGRRYHNCQPPRNFPTAVLSTPSSGWPHENKHFN